MEDMFKFILILYIGFFTIYLFHPKAIVFNKKKLVLN